MAADPLKPLADLLPAPLDTALLAEFSERSPLSMADRASANGLLACWADFWQEDPRHSRRNGESLRAECHAFSAVPYIAYVCVADGGDRERHSTVSYG